MCTDLIEVSTAELCPRGPFLKGSDHLYCHGRDGLQEAESCPSSFSIPSHIQLVMSGCDHGRENTCLSLAHSRWSNAGSRKGTNLVASYLTVTLPLPRPISLPYHTCSSGHMGGCDGLGWYLTLSATVMGPEFVRVTCAGPRRALPWDFFPEEVGRENVFQLWGNS